tara:strand:- start:666 stop:797 length:132 start_codon:yes stop_codon:yes gene_type:complete
MILKESADDKEPKKFSIVFLFTYFNFHYFKHQPRSFPKIGRSR